MSLVWGLCVGLPILLISVAASVVVVWWRRRKANQTQNQLSLYLPNHPSAALRPPVISYKRLRWATNGFSPDLILRKGGFVSVYRGHLKDGSAVSVKHIHKNRPTAAAGGEDFLQKKFINELLILSSLNHPNLVKLRGYLANSRGMFIVYELVSNGTLYSHLQAGTLTAWEVRIDIALQIAIALEYIHSASPPVVHRDIKTENIFLEDDMVVKLGDFGNFRRMDEIVPDSSSSSSGVVTDPQGTPGYEDPEYYMTFRLTAKSDVYSLGVVLFELVSGMKVVDRGRDKILLAEYMVTKIGLGLMDQVEDPVLMAGGGGGGGGVRMRESIRGVANLAVRCVAAKKNDRPDTTEVVAELRHLQSLLLP